MHKQMSWIFFRSEEVNLVTHEDKPVLLESFGFGHEEDLPFHHLAGLVGPARHR
jgi:hypothetical protein